MISSACAIVSSTYMSIRFPSKPAGAFTRYFVILTDSIVIDWSGQVRANYSVCYPSLAANSTSKDKKRDKA